MLLQACVNADATNLEDVCTSLGLNYLKILDYATTDIDAQGMLRVCIGMLMSHVHEKFYNGSISKCQADEYIFDLNSISEIYLNVSQGDAE